MAAAAKVVNVSSRVEVRNLTSPSGVLRNSRALVDAMHAFREVARSLSPPSIDLESVRCSLVRLDSTSRRRGRLLAPYRTEPVAALCVARDNVRGGALILSSRILPDALTVDLEPGDLCVFRDLEVWQEPLVAVDVDFDLSFDLLLMDMR
jgi:hypothetical protein